MSTSGQAADLGYRPELDGLRAIAVSVVLVGHFFEGSWYVDGSFLGVDLFFVLSGFLITRLLMDERAKTGGTNLRGFYRRRAARLLPALILLCAFVLVDALSVQRLATTSESVRGVGAALGYVANWIRVFGINDSPIGHTWSLSVEEQFYVVWPAAFLLILRRGTIRTVRWWAIGGFCVAAVQMAIRSLAGVDGYVLYNSTDTHGAVTLLGGCALATLPPAATARIARAALAPAAVLLVALLAGPDGRSAFYGRGGFALITVACAIVIAAAQQPGRVRALLCIRPLVWLGRRSYGVYLWHIPMLLLALSFVDGPADMAVRVSAGLLTLTAATLSYALVEQPLRRRLGRPRRRRQPTPRAPATRPPQPAALS